MNFKKAFISELKPAKYNPRKDLQPSDPEYQRIKKSIEEFGYCDPIIVNADYTVIGGHQRLKVLKELGQAQIDVVVVDIPKNKEKALNVALNKISGEWDTQRLTDLLGEIKADGLLELTGFDEAEFNSLLEDLHGTGQGDTVEQAHAKLADKFIVPPFSVLDTRQGYWQQRKAAWIALGIKSELGRDAPQSGSKKVSKYVDGIRQTGLVCESDTSIADPVLCEIVYRWFCPDGGSVIDPFAGGSVRGVVAGYLGHPYTGIDLRADQIIANEIQATAINPKVKPRWITGNSEQIAELAPGEYDLVFSCPPYYDLEIYSDNPGDLSAIGTYDEFITTYRNIIAQCCGMLKDNRFACFVVGDIRDKKGFYRGFVGDTISAFEDAGCTLYNEGILVNVIGSLPIRITKQFEYRKLGKCHQNVLVFYKGDPKKIKEEFGTVSIPTEALEPHLGGT